jgi:hypothetical protein
MKRFCAPGTLLILIAGLLGCRFFSPAPITSATESNISTTLQATQPVDLTQATLENFTYQVQPSGIPLKNGGYEDYSLRIESHLVEPIAFGDLNGDDQKDAAVVLATNTGGSGTFYTLSAVLNQGGVPVEETYVKFGDRQELLNLKIVDRRIVLDYMTQGPRDGLCCPNQHILSTYVLENNELHLVSYQRLESKEVLATPLPNVIFIDQPKIEDCFAIDVQVNRPFEIQGRIGQTPAEKKLSYRVMDEDGGLLMQGETPVNGDPGASGLFSFQIIPQKVSTILPYIHVEIADTENGILNGRTEITLRVDQ